LTLWNAIVDDYQAAFWMSYWSDQVWRAALFVTYMSQKDMAKAKEIQAKLPFSFTKTDWQKHSYHSLTHLHQELATIDFSLKNGGLMHQLEHCLIARLQDHRVDQA
jgi:hypothetical protein